MRRLVIFVKEKRRQRWIEPEERLISRRGFQRHATKET
jgi:hypothetical protein